MVRICRNLVFLSLPALIFVLVIAELFFRYLLPASEVPQAYFDPFKQVLRFDTNSQRAGISTRGKFAQQRGRWRINNYGWNSDIDYVAYQTRHKPLIAIIGDSYIEAFQVNVENNIAAVLRRRIKDTFDVYSFGVSGAPLAGYLQMSRYVNDHFKPDVIVFNIIHNDFDESVLDLTPGAGHFLQITYKDGTFVELPIIPYEPSSIRRFLGKSALVRYLAINLALNFDMRTLVRKPSRSDFNANIDVKKVLANRDIVKAATLFLVKRITEENPATKLVFMIDAPRRDIYSGTLNNSSVMWMHDILRDACIQNGSHFIDLTKPFAERFNKDHIRFNPEYDSHWNEAGHSTAAKVLYESLISYGIIPKARPS